MVSEQGKAIDIPIVLNSWNCRLQEYLNSLLHDGVLRKVALTQIW